MKKIKLLICLYIGVALFAYISTMRIERLESREDINNQNKAIVLKIQ